MIRRPTEKNTELLLERLSTGQRALRKIRWCLDRLRSGLHACYSAGQARLSIQNMGIFREEEEEEDNRVSPLYNNISKTYTYIIYNYTHIYIHTYIITYVYIYIHRERERERDDPAIPHHDLQNPRRGKSAAPWPFLGWLLPLPVVFGPLAGKGTVFWWFNFCGVKTSAASHHGKRNTGV